MLTPIDLPQTDAGPFLSYALQWEAFGVIALIGLGVFIFREAFVPRPDDGRSGRRRSGQRDPAAADPAAPRPGGRSRRRERRVRDGFDRSQLYDD